LTQKVTLIIDGKKVEASAETSILEAGRKAGIYIPSLCYHPDLPLAKMGRPAPYVYQGSRLIKNVIPEKKAEGCGICVVDVEGQPEPLCSCETPVREGMVVETATERVVERRQSSFMKILSRHPHACLTCAQKEGCSLNQCSSNVKENERCCPIFRRCELQSLAEYVGVSPATPQWIPTNLPILKDDPLIIRNYNLCIGCTRCVRACMDLRGIEALGFVHDEKGQIQVGTTGPGLSESGCRFCTACVEVCPTGALTDKNDRPGRKENNIVPCRSACPACIDVPAYIRLVSLGKTKEAHAVIREKVPFPGVLGRVCTRPCEEVCRRGRINEPMAICALKRYAAEAPELYPDNAPRAGPDTGKRVAVVGAGPAGLTAAFYLRKKGHAVCVFDENDAPGGMMRYGIPAYRLPRDVLDREIARILGLGVEFRPRTRLGKDFDLDAVFSRGFAALFLAVGASISRVIKIEGSDLPDVLWGVDFLRCFAQGRHVPVKKRVVVIGGGNVALDAARTALRLGASGVSIACLESRKEMPASEWEVKEAVSEGIRVMPCRKPLKILNREGRITGVEFVNSEGVSHKNGVTGAEFEDIVEVLEADQVIVAIGQSPDLSFLASDSAIRIRHGLIVSNQDTLATGKSGVYAGGDATFSPGSVINAIAAGRKAAVSIDKALGGSGVIDEIIFKREAPSNWLGREKGFADRGREKVPEVPPGERICSFKEVSLGYGDDQAGKEAGRCLQCDVRLYMSSNPLPPKNVLPFNPENIKNIPETEGVFRIYSDSRNLVLIKGTPNLKKDILDRLGENPQFAWFDYEEHMMYSRREIELIQQYLQAHGEMPGGGDSDLEDLF
jgi:NADPH-dependent glutamate synthase beta subunit-like oxidoreductase